MQLFCQMAGQIFPCRWHNFLYFQDYPLPASDLKSLKDFPSPQPLNDLPQYPISSIKVSTSHVFDTSSSSKKTSSKKKKDVKKELISLLKKSIQEEDDNDNDSSNESVASFQMIKGPDPFVDIQDP